MRNTPLRRSQLIAPFGVGSMTVGSDGTGLVVGALDSWFDPQTDVQMNIDEFIIHEWRLEKIMKVDHFRLPPDFRKPKNFDIPIPNLKLTIPMVRFPQWHYCPRCNTLEQMPLFLRERPVCQVCERLGRKNSRMVQVPFVAICKFGHLQDFPWREWAHRNASTTCTGRMQLLSYGDPTLAGQWVKCDCGAYENLSRITEGDGDETYLSKNLDPKQDYNCQGIRPWTGKTEPVPCSAPIKGSLRSASNNYYARVFSALYIPTQSIPPEIDAILRSPIGSAIFNTLRDIAVETPQIRAALQNKFPGDLKNLSDQVIDQAIETFPHLEMTSDDDIAESVRTREYEVLSSEVDTDTLQTQPQSLAKYKNVGLMFEKIILVPRLRETRVLAGFSRIYPESEGSLNDTISLMWDTLPPSSQRWLPAYIVHGEGISSP